MATVGSARSPKTSNSTRLIGETADEAATKSSRLMNVEVDQACGITDDIWPTPSF